MSKVSNVVAGKHRRCLCEWCGEDTFANGFNYRKDLYMTFKHPKYRLRFLSTVLALSIMISLVAPVCATDDIHSLEQTTEDLENNLSSLNSELAQLDKEISSISSKIKDMNARIKTIQDELAIAKGEEESQYEAMKARIQYMYENGSTSFLEILCSASSLADFIKRADYFATVNEYDRAALKKITDTREAIAQKELQLTEEKENLTTLLAELDKKEAILQKQISDASSELSSYTAKLDNARKEAQKAEAALKQEVKPVAPPKDEPNNSGSSTSNGEYTATASDLELFAALIECEAGSSDYEGMLAVASVVVNRMKHSSYPDTLRGVIFQSGQFPPAHNGKVDKILKRGVKDSCLKAAQDALNGKNNVGNCLSFRSAGSGHVGTVIGSNVFF